MIKCVSKWFVECDEVSQKVSVIECVSGCDCV